MRPDPGKYLKESDLCRDFIDVVAKEGDWVCYPETAGFDILLRRKADDIQIGVEAKLKLNGKVVAQALPEHIRLIHDFRGPDYRAVLVPEYATSDLAPICEALGITVIVVRRQFLTDKWNSPIWPPLPKPGQWYAYGGEGDWFDWCPSERCRLPDYVPDVRAGDSAPVKLSDWKIRAIKLSILLDQRPVTRRDFKALGLSPSRWTDPYAGWLVKSDRGYMRGKHCPDFRAQHPKNYAEIEADKPKWAALFPKELAL